MKKIATLLITALCFASAAAQDEFLEELEEVVRQYTVEIIIFSYEENVSVGTEIFLPDEAPVAKNSLLDEDETDIKPDEVMAKEDTESIIRELELVLLDKEDFTLDKAARQFALLDVYETIMHFGWTQPTYPQEQTPPIELRILGKPPAGLDGTFTLYLSRYLHLVVDLALDGPETSGGSAAINTPLYSSDPAYDFGDARLQNDDGFAQQSQRVRFRIQENRIVKNGEIRYFDHPKFGVLAKITRVEEEDDEDAEKDDIAQQLLSRARQ
jgi:hypothetical protein